jgi:hypothetical protein
MTTTITETQAAELKVGDVYDTRCGVGDLAYATITSVEHFTLPGGGDRVGITYEGDAICNSRILVAGSTVRVKVETPDGDAPIVHAEELDEQGRGTGHALCGQDGALASSTWQVTCEKRLAWHDEPATSASAQARAICPARDHQPKQPRHRTGKAGRFNTPARRADVLNRLTARVNAHVLTAASFLRGLGADDDTVRRFASQVGKRAKALAATRGVQPTLTGLAVVGRHLVRCLAYSQSDAEILRQAVTDYPKTSHLIQIGA